MGLIQRAKSVPINDFPPSPETKNSLLTRVQSSSYDVVLTAFRGFLKETGVERGGVLFPSPDGISVLLLNTGFDLTTANRFSPEIEKLNVNYPILLNFYEETGKNLAPYLRFFSSREAESLNALYFCRVEIFRNTNIFLVIADSMLDISRDKINIDAASHILTKLLRIFEKNHEIFLLLSRIASINQSPDSIRAHAQSALSIGKRATFIRISMLAFDDNVRNELDSTAMSQDR